MVHSKRSSKRVREQAARSSGQPVVVTLTDGRQFIGTVQRIYNGQLYLAGVQVKNATKKSRKTTARKSAAPTRRQARTSAFLFPKLQQGMNSAAAGVEQAEQAVAVQGGGFGFGGLTDWMGFMEKALPMIKMGMGVIKSIIPLLGALKV